MDGGFGNLWELMGRFSGASDLLITLPKNDRISIILGTFSLWQKLYGKTRPHCHNSKGEFLGESFPLSYIRNRVGTSHLYGKFMALWQWGKPK